MKAPQLRHSKASPVRPYWSPAFRQNREALATSTTAQAAARRRDRLRRSVFSFAKPRRRTAAGDPYGGLEDPRGVIEIGGRTIPVRAIRTRSERLKVAVDRAYADKYDTKGSQTYVRGFKRPTRRDTTTELVPVSGFRATAGRPYAVASRRRAR